MATMLIPGHDRDAIATIVERVDAELADLFDGGADSDEYTPTEDDERTTSLFLAPLVYTERFDTVGLEDARTALDELAYDEWVAAERDAVAA